MEGNDRHLQQGKDSGNNRVECPIGRKGQGIIQDFPYLILYRCCIRILLSFRQITKGSNRKSVFPFQYHHSLLSNSTTDPIRAQSPYRVLYLRKLFIIPFSMRFAVEWKKYWIWTDTPPTPSCQRGSTKILAGIIEK